MTKLKLKSDTFKFIFNFFFIILFSFIKVSKNVSAKYYQENKERLQKKHVKDIKIFLKNKKKQKTMWSVTLQKSLRR